ncbi:MAG TPA: DMT family transporter [Candidatus Baltobacteraceae bacterium]|nr:DMT family transporter [Candidatus Baltobacteraceae bacterium]
MRTKPSNWAIAAGLAVAVFLWGANNTGVKFLVRSWPPITIGSSRFLAAGLVLMGLLRWTRLFGAQRRSPPAELEKALWWRGGLSLAVYIVAFNWALKLTAVSHVALYLGAAPVWALLWEGRPPKTWKSAQRYGAAALAFCGVLVLFVPLLRNGRPSSILGEVIGMSCGVLWTNYGVQCRVLGRELSGAEISAHTFLRAGLLLAPLAMVELSRSPMPWRLDLVLIQIFCILGGGVVAFALWTGALRHWKTTQVYLFSNLIPLSNMIWANACLGEPITGTFWVAMLLIGAGVCAGQATWRRVDITGETLKSPAG